LNNLFISYDLYRPDRDYADLYTTIKSLGNWAHVKLTLWYVNSNLSAASARDRLWARMQSQDKLVVIDASNNDAAWNGIPDEQSNFIKNHWRL
jgi:hypothetical protein